MITKVAAAVAYALLVASCANSRAPERAMVDAGALDAGDDAPTAPCAAGGAFVTQHLAPDRECIVEPDRSVFIPVGVYDISSGSSGNGDECSRPYTLSLLVNSCVDDVLQLHSAEITLRDIDRAVIRFDQNETRLPNPFLVTTNSSLFPPETAAPSTAVAFVEAIPTAYAEQLDGFVGQELLAEVEIFGTTQHDIDIEARAFVYPIKICSGCLQVCGSTIAAETPPEEIYGEDICPDNAAADGRMCVDDGC
jgi:hypothetical protein